MEGEGEGGGWRERGRGGTCTCRGRGGGRGEGRERGRERDSQALATAGETAEGERDIVCAHTWICSGFQQLVEQGHQQVEQRWTAQHVHQEFLEWNGMEWNEQQGPIPYQYLISG